MRKIKLSGWAHTPVCIFHGMPNKLVRVIVMEVSGKRRKEKTKRRWLDSIKHKRTVGALNQAAWRWLVVQNIDIWERCWRRRCLRLRNVSLPVGDAESFHAPVDGQHVCDVSVVEPEPWRVDQHRPVVGVAALEEWLHRLHLNKTSVGHPQFLIHN